MSIKSLDGALFDLVARLEKNYEDELWEMRAQRSIPWWMRLQPFGFVLTGMNGLIIWLPIFDDVPWPNVILYIAGALATALWAAGKVRLRNTRRWLALQRAVGVEP